MMKNTKMSHFLSLFHMIIGQKFSDHDGGGIKNMSKWIWIIEHYFTPKPPIEAPLQEQWIFSYRSQEEDRDKKDIHSPSEKLKETT
ncbi:MAG TPA: hypothetical protein GX532_00045 [Clostridia bacterium]|jgi:hypothetical protein|nr:hypothetical protein [Clostridia bacterium]